MRQPSEFVGHQVMMSTGRMWHHRVCDAPYVVVDWISRDDKHQMRGLCSVCLAESYIPAKEGQRPVDAKWPVKLAMTRDPRWPAWVSKGVFDSE